MFSDLETTTVERGDVSLHLVYSRVYPHERRAPVVFLHGYPDTHTTWSNQLEDLATTHPVATFDMRGVGQSTASTEPDGRSIPRYLDDIAAVIDRVAGPTGQVHLVGHDWGGVLGWYFLDNPERAQRVRSFTAIAAPHPGAAHQMFATRLRRHRLHDLASLAEQLRKSWYIFLFQLPWIPELYLGRDALGMWRRTLRSGGVRRGDPELQSLDEPAARRALTHPLALYRQIFRNLVLRARHGPRVDIPVSVLIPRHDLALSPDLYEAIPEFVADVEQHTLDANHWAHRSHAAQVNQILDEFISRHDR